MLSFLPKPLVGILALILYCLNALFWPSLLFMVAAFRLVPLSLLQTWSKRTMHVLPYYWQTCNDAIKWLTAKTQFEIQSNAVLQADESYLMLCNHQSWADILILQKVFRGKIPLLKFFMKRQLLWSLPMASWACWLLDFPFMARHSKAQLAKHPALKGRDLEVTKRACAKFKSTPTTVISFIEGTRFTKAKQKQQASPYQYLLRPRAGGLAFALAAMQGSLHKLINVTLIYPPEQATMWAFLCGRQHKIIVQIEVLPITDTIVGDYETNREFRVQFQSWLNQLWQEKDQNISNTRFA